MLSPKRVKFRKQQRGRMRGVATRGNTIAFGQFALGKTHRPGSMAPTGFIQHSIQFGGRLHGYGFKGGLERG